MSSEPPVPPQPTAAPPAPPAAAPSSNRGIMVVLSYLGILALVPLLVEKDDKEVQWHAKHGLVLLVSEIILFIGLGLMAFLLSLATHGIAGLFFMMVYTALALGLLVLHIMCIVKGVNGQRLIIPQISAFADRF